MAKLTFEGMPPIDGDAEAGGDYVRFRTNSLPDADAVAEPLDGVIDLDGQSAKVFLESAQTHDDGVIELVLRRYSPSA